MHILKCFRYICKQKRDCIFFCVCNHLHTFVVFSFVGQLDGHSQPTDSHPSSLWPSWQILMLTDTICLSWRSARVWPFHPRNLMMATQKRTPPLTYIPSCTPLSLLFWCRGWTTLKHSRYMFTVVLRYFEHRDLNTVDVLMWVRSPNYVFFVFYIKISNTWDQAWISWKELKSKFGLN